MPNLTVGFWNLQNYGSNTARAPWVRGVASAEGAAMIAAFVNALGIDVLMVMEVMQTAQPSLDSLRNALNESQMNPIWCYDWIPGSYGVDRRAVQLNEMSWWGGGARFEGYAVFWKSGDARFTMVPARYPVSRGVSSDPNNPNNPMPANCLSLVDEGRQLGRRPGITYTGSTLLTGYNPAVDALRPFDDYMMVKNWSDLPVVSAGKGEATPPRMAIARRPAYCVISLNNPAIGAADRQIPLIAYHAPSYPPRASLGTWVSGLGRQLAVTRTLAANGTPTDNWTQCNKVIAAGDYNVRANAPNAFETYASYTYQYTNRAWETGANCANMAPVPTTVQLSQYDVNTQRYSGADIMSNDVNDYYLSSIDNLFYRNLANAAPSRPDLLTMLMDEGVPFAGVIDQFDGPLQTAVNAAAGLHNGNPYTGIDQNGDYIWTYPDIYNFEEFREQVQASMFSEARQAAEFLHIFVSDHLPLVMTFQAW
jgi:hypothetical protein